MRIQQGGPQADIELRFLILTPSPITSSNEEGTLNRVGKFVSLTGGKQCAVLFLHRPADSNVGDANTLSALNDLQILLMRRRLDVPLLPLDCAGSLLRIITAFARPYGSNASTLRPEKVITSLDLVPQLGNLSRETVLALTDLTTCLRDIANLGEDDAQKLLDSGTSEEELSALFQCWNKEYMVD